MSYLENGRHVAKFSGKCGTVEWNLFTDIHRRAHYHTVFPLIEAHGFY